MNFKKRFIIGLITVPLFVLFSLIFIFGEESRGNAHFGFTLTSFLVIIFVGVILIVTGVERHRYYEKSRESQYFINRRNEQALDDIDMFDGREFEIFCAKIIRKNGFSNVKVTPVSGDQGVDIIAYKDNLKYAFQCKHYSNSLGNKPIQEVFAGKTFYQCNVAVVITNSTFTEGAKVLAKSTGVLLWDRSVLHKLVKNAEKHIGN